MKVHTHEEAVQVWSVVILKVHLQLCGDCEDSQRYSVVFYKKRLIKADVICYSSSCVGLVPA